jgi:hypothetical protein
LARTLQVRPASSAHSFACLSLPSCADSVRMWIRPLCSRSVGLVGQGATAGEPRGGAGAGGGDNGGRAAKQGVRAGGRAAKRGRVGDEATTQGGRMGRDRAAAAALVRRFRKANWRPIRRCHCDAPAKRTKRSWRSLRYGRRSNKNMQSNAPPRPTPPCMDPARRKATTTTARLAEASASDAAHDKHGKLVAGASGSAALLPRAWEALSLYHYGTPRLHEGAIMYTLLSPRSLILRFADFRRYVNNRAQSSLRLGPFCT